MTKIRKKQYGYETIAWRAKAWKGHSEYSVMPLHPYPFWCSTCWNLNLNESETS